jgi:membrane protease YdiL (CAAX protease family)
MRFLRPVFWNATQHRLRAGWRLVLQLFFFFLVVIGVAVLGKALAPGLVSAVVVSCVYLVAGLSLAWLLARFLDRRPFADYGFHLSGAWWLDLAFGFALGAVLMTGIFLVEWLAGWITVAGLAAGGSALRLTAFFLTSFLVYSVVAFNEEFAVRGYQLRNLAEGQVGRHSRPRLALWLALLGTSALFGLAHLGNDGATAMSTGAIVLAGLALGLPLVLTGELALSIGLHLSWNLFQNAYGFPVSGSVPSRNLLQIEQGGPSQWTGGEFGPEAGLLAILWTALGCGLTVLWVWWRRQRVAFNLALAQYQPRTAPEKPGHSICLEPGAPAGTEPATPSASVLGPGAG